MTASLKEIVGITDDELLAVAAVWRSESSDLKSLMMAGGLDPSADFRGGDFRGWPLSGQDIRGIDFTGADLRGTGVHQAIFDDTTNFLDTVIDEGVTLTTVHASPSIEAYSNVRGALAEIRQLTRKNQHLRALGHIGDLIDIVQSWRPEWDALRWATILGKCLVAVRIPDEVEDNNAQIRERVQALKPKFHEATHDLLVTLLKGAKRQPRAANTLFRTVIDLFEGPNLIVGRDELVEIFFAALQSQRMNAGAGYLTLLNAALKVAATMRRQDLAEKLISEAKALVDDMGEISSPQARLSRFRLAVMEADFEVSSGRVPEAVAILLRALEAHLEHGHGPMANGMETAIVEAVELLASHSSRETYMPFLQWLAEVPLPLEKNAEMGTQKTYAARLQSLSRSLGERGDDEAAISVIGLEIEIRRSIFTASPTALNGGYLVRAAVRYHTTASKLGMSSDWDTLQLIENGIVDLHQRRPSGRNQQNLTELAILKHVIKRDSMRYSSS